MPFEYIFLTIWLIIAISLPTFLYHSGKKALSIFPPLDTVKVRFDENFVTGQIDKMGTAKKILHIVVTNDELWIKSSAFHAGFSKHFGFPLKVKLATINDIQLVKNKTIINLNNNTSIALKLKETTRFIEVLKGLIN